MINELKAQRLAAIKLTENGAPAAPTNPFFGVGPITDATTDEANSRLRRLNFDRWVEVNYRKMDDTGRDLGGFTTAEIGRSMHRGYPADKVLIDMMRAIHRYFGFPKENRLAVGLGGGHSGFTVCVQHLLNANLTNQKVYIDTPRPESDLAGSAGFFRQSWATQVIEMHRFAAAGSEARIHFASSEGVIPSADELARLGISVFIGVGHETTGANSYKNEEIIELLKWLSGDPENRHAVLDATSMLGAMPWGPQLVHEVMSKCCLFMPFQKAIGGICGYFVNSFTPAALRLIESNQANPSWAIPRQLKIAPPIDPKQPLSAKRSVDVGPFYDPETDRMLGGVINTFSTLAFAETTFNLLEMEKMIGPIETLNERSATNREMINNWVATHSLLSHAVSDRDRRGAAVTLLKINDNGVTDPTIHARIIAKSKQLLGYEGLTHPNGSYEKGLDAARYVNAFPGTPGDYRAWVGGIRQPSDISALLDNLQYAYLRAKIVVIEEELHKLGASFEDEASSVNSVGEATETIKVIIIDPIGLRHSVDGSQDFSEAQNYIEKKGGIFHIGEWDGSTSLEIGKLHFFYQPHLNTADEILAQTSDGRYDAVIAAASFIPPASQFRIGGVRIGAGTGNMGSHSWGGPNGEGGPAALMNTPGINSRATAQMAMKALLKVMPDLPVDVLHQRVLDNSFDTGKHLAEYPTEKLEGKKVAVLGYGNIGREFAKLAKTFNMDVAVYARPSHRENILAEGYEYAASVEEAANGAEVLTVHLGLGRRDEATGKYANEGLIDEKVLNQLNPRAVILNYDRGELVDVSALGKALACGRVRHAAIDADIFLDNNGVRGPLQPYLALLPEHGDKLELLPHAAADTDHPTRVAGAKQAIDQIYELVLNKTVVNLKGDLPEGYINGGERTPNGIGTVTEADITALILQTELLHELRNVSEQLTAVMSAFDSVSDDRKAAQMAKSYLSMLTTSAMRQQQLLARAGLLAPPRI
jgi:lactate dehydrogenase-like 2-hydroxyacid dehydrogenase